MSEQDITRIPGSSHYNLDYLQGGRIFSYAHQIEGVINFAPQRVLEIGTGNGLVASTLRKIGFKVTTLDMQPVLLPDAVGSVVSVPFMDSVFDVSLCCQVLEHLPFSQFSLALRELRRVTKHGLILSLPDSSRHCYVIGKIPRCKRLSLTFNFGRLATVPDAAFQEFGHYWEIGYRGYALNRIKKEIQDAGWRMEKSYRVPELPWHRFFMLVP